MITDKNITDGHLGIMLLSESEEGGISIKNLTKLSCMIGGFDILPPLKSQWTVIIIS